MRQTPCPFVTLLPADSNSVGLQGYRKVESDETEI